MRRKTKILILIALLFLLLASAWSGFILFTPTVMLIDPPYILRPDASLLASLEVRPESASRVWASITLTNCTPHDIWLYKPLLCAEGYTEEVFYVMTPDKHNLQYEGGHREKYVGGEPGPLPMVLPREESNLYIKLAAGASHTTMTNLSELFDFEHHRGKYMASYFTFMPVMANGKHVYEMDPAARSPTPEPVPVYHSVDSDYGRKRGFLYTHFEVK